MHKAQRKMTVSFCFVWFSWFGFVLLLLPCVLGNKLTQKDSADSGVQFITPAGPRQSFLLAKDPDQGPYIPLYTLSVPAQTHLPKFPETSLNKGKERYNES